MTNNQKPHGPIHLLNATKLHALMRRGVGNKTRNVAGDVPKYVAGVFADIIARQAAAYLSCHRVKDTTVRLGGGEQSNGL